MPNLMSITVSEIAPVLNHSFRGSYKTLEVTIVTYLVNTYAVLYGLGDFIYQFFGGALLNVMGIKHDAICMKLSAIISRKLLLVINESVKVAAEVFMTLTANLYGSGA